LQIKLIQSIKTKIIMKQLGLFVLAVSLLICQTLTGQKGMEPSHLHSMKMVIESSVSPNGKHIAYVLMVPKPLADGPGFAYRELHVYDIASGQTKGLITGNVSIASVSWHPSEEIIYYRTANRSTKGRQVFSIGLQKKAEEEQVTDFERGIISYEFVNSETIIFTAIDSESNQKTEMKKAGYDMEIFEEQLQHVNLYLWDVKSKKAKQLTKNMTVFEFSVSPDGSRIAAAIAPRNLVDDSYMFKRIHILDAQTGELIEKIENPGKLGKMVWSPDGKRLAFIASSKLEDSVEGSLFIFETGKGVSYGDIRNYVHGMELSVKDVIWESNTSVLYSAEQSVDIVVRRQGVADKGSSEIIAPSIAVFRSMQLVGDFLYFTGHTPSYPQELMRFDMKKNKAEKLTDHNLWLKDVKLAQQKMINYKARDGKDIHGVLVYPLNYTQGKQYPLIVYIHGGPEACVQNGWVNNYSQWGQFAASRDYFVFFPNYRASSGRGVEFTMEGYAALLEKEYEDVIDGIDYLIAEKMVDPKKVGIGGGSYGGYFAAWSATKYTDRFAAAVVFVGVTNQVSKRNLTDIPWEDYYVHWGFWTHENHDKVWEASPVKYAHMSKTPTLILHGEEDTRIPVAQGMELYRSLKLHSKAAVRFVIYPGEGHGNGKNTNRYDYLVRTLEWFDFYLKENNPIDVMPDVYPQY
jgi:dipeptidyl aminopeptidase/acylaminoacyl peptidase